MDLSALTESSAAETSRPPADNEAAMLLLGLYEQPSPQHTPQGAQGQLQGYQAERAGSHQQDFQESSHLTPTNSSTPHGFQRRGNSPFDQSRPPPSVSPVNGSITVEATSPHVPSQPTLVSGVSTNRMLPPVPPSVAQQQAQAQSQSQVDYAQARQTSMNGTIIGYRGPEAFLSGQQSQLGRAASGSYSHQPLTATSSKSPSLSTVSPKQTFATSASAIGQNFNRAGPGTGGSPTSFTAPVIPTGQNRISHLLNNPTSSVMPPSPGRNGHAAPLPYHTHTYSSQPYKLVSTNNPYSSSSTPQQPVVKAQSNTSRTVYSGKQEHSTSMGEGQNTLRGYDSTAAPRMNGNASTSAIHYSLPVSPYHTQPIMQTASAAGRMQYVSVPGKGIMYTSVQGMDHASFHPQHQQPLQQQNQPQQQQQHHQQSQAGINHTAKQEGPSAQASFTSSQPVSQASPVAVAPPSTPQSDHPPLQPVALKAAQSVAPRKRKRSASGSQANTKVLQPKSAPPTAPTATAGSNARPDLPHFMGFDNQLYRCICDTTIEPERGSSVQCERCLAWQHAGCFGIKEETLEGLTYFCHICKGGSYNRNEEYIAYVKDLESRLMSGEVVSGILSVNPTLQLVSETTVPRDGKKTRGSARGRPRVRENSNVSGTRPSVPPAEAVVEGPVPEHEVAVLPSVAEKPSSAITTIPKPQRRKTGTARGSKSRVKDGMAATTAEPPTTPLVSSHSNRPATGNASRPTTHSPDRETQAATRENTAVSAGGTVIMDPSAPLRLLEYIPLKENMIRGQAVKRTVYKLLVEWEEPDGETSARPPTNGIYTEETQTTRALQEQSSDADARIVMDPIQTASSSDEFSRDILGPPIPPAIIQSRSLEDVAVPTYVKAKDKDETFFFPPGRAFLSVPDPKDAPSTAPIRPSVVYGVHVRRMAVSGDFLGELKGEVKDAETYHRDPINQYGTLGITKPFTRRLGPPVDLVIDGRIYGNDMRFVRSGCHPNAVFRPIIFQRIGRKEPSVCFGIFATTTIAAGQEVILGWEWDDDHIIHALAADGPSISKGSRLQHRFALVVSHLLGSFRSCACDDDTTCVWLRLMQLSVAGQPIPALNFRPNKKSRKAKDSPVGYGPLVGAVRGWRRNEIARFEAELERELLEKHNSAFEAEQREVQDMDHTGTVLEEYVSDEQGSESEGEMEDYREGSIGVDGSSEGEEHTEGSIAMDLVEHRNADVTYSPASFGKVSLQMTGRISQASDEGGNTEPEDGEEDVDMDEDNDDSAIAHTDLGDVQMAEGRYERASPSMEPDGFQSMADTTLKPSAHITDASPQAVVQSMSEGELSPPRPDETLTLHNGRTAEEDSPLTSADPRDTPSPLLLSAKDAFASQMTGDRDPYDDSGGEDDGNLTDVTASTIPLSHHSDDEDNLESDRESISVPQRQSAVPQEKNEEIDVSPADLRSPANERPVNTLYRRRRVLSPSSPIDEAERIISTPSGVRMVSAFRRSPERAPSSSLSPVLPSNSLADMFNEEEAQATCRNGRITPVQQKNVSSSSPKVDSTGEEKLQEFEPLVTQVVSLASRGAFTSTAAPEEDDSDRFAKEATSAERLMGRSEMGDEQVTESSADLATQPEDQPLIQAGSEPPPPPKKRRLDLKKFMTSKRTNVLESNVRLPRAPDDTSVNAGSTAAISQTTVIENDFPVSINIPPPTSGPPPLSPPPPPPILSPAAPDVLENSKSSEAPWWTSNFTSRPSLSSLSETRPKFVTLSGDLNSAGALNSDSPEVYPNAERILEDEKPIIEPTPVTVLPQPSSALRPWSLIEVEDKDQEKHGYDSKAFSTFSLGLENGVSAPAPPTLTPRPEPPKALTSPFDWHTKLPTAGIASHWSKIPPALEQKDLPPHVDPDSRRSDRFGSISSASRSPPKSNLLLMSPQRIPPAGPRAFLAPVRPSDVKDSRDLLRDREADRDRDIRERDREREVPRGPRVEYRGRGGPPRGGAFTPRGTWHADSYRGRARGTGEYRGRGFFPRGRGAFFNNRGRGA
ncbi:hypothetical protein QFC22_005425 [Naganishia vaughanmartiniae]|uniref:Uncharacterized protein n=1 Tax=Naganishia vaughanmartiniae TaxID=1424756 RepID=A0ACC2WX50_9TREE|nr:hypothetical protein QFC22_005425 [Naganishia vaughanmartiniae]